MSSDKNIPEMQRLALEHPELLEILERFSFVYQDTDAKTLHEKLRLINEYFNKSIKRGRNLDEIVPYTALRAVSNGQYDEIRLNTLISDFDEARLTRSEMEIIKKNPDYLPSFEYLLLDTLCGSFINENGRVYKMETVFPNGKIATTIVNEFKDEDNFKRASELQRLDNEVVEYLRKVFAGTEYESLLRMIITKPSKHADRRFLANTFYRGRDLRRELQVNEDIYENLESLLDIAKTDIFLSFFRDKHLRTETGTTNSEQIIPLIEENQGGRFLKLMYRTDPTLEERLKGKGVLRNNGVDEGKFQANFEDEYLFWKFFQENIVKPLEEEYQFPTHGDGAPTNVMVIREDDGEQGESAKKYARIDKEKGTRDVIQSHMSQLWVKSPIFDYSGESVLDSDGLEARVAHTNELAFLMYQLAEDFGRDDLVTKNGERLSQKKYIENFRRITDLAVARDHYIWAIRYKSYIGKSNIDPKMLRKAAQYHYTLFANELVRQGLIKDIFPPLIPSPLAYTNNIFGEPLTDKELKQIYDEINPKERYVSFHEGITLRTRAETEKAIRGKLKRRRHRNIGIGALAFSMLAGGAAITVNSLDEMVENKKLKDEVHTATFWNPVVQKEENLRRAYENMVSQYNSVHPNDIGEITEEQLEEICVNEEVDSKYVMRIISQNDRSFNPYWIDERFRGLIIFDTYEICRDGKIYNPLENVTEGVKRYKEILLKHGLDPADPLHEDDYQGLSSKERKKLEKRYYKAIMEFLIREEDMDYLERFGRTALWKRFEENLGFHADYIVYGDFKISRPLWPYTEPFRIHVGGV